MKHILVIGGRDHTIHKLKKLGVSYTLFQTPELTTEEQIKSSRRLVVCDYEKTSEVLQMAEAIHAFDKFDAVVSFAEYGMYPAVLCAKQLNLPSNDVKPVEYTRNKIKMRQLLGENKFATVQYAICDSVLDVKNFFNRMKCKKIIIKPFSGGGSCGVSLIESARDIENAWKWTAESGVLPILAEEYIEGQEFSVESISLNGKHEIAMITEKQTTGFPHHIETGHQAPARLDKITENLIAKTVTDFLDLIGQKTAPAHTEIKLTEDGCKLIESQTRIGGDQIWEMTEMITGIDLMTETICQLLEMPFPKRESKARAAAIRFFMYENRIIRDIRNVNLVEKLPNVVRVNCTLTPGAKLGPLKSSDSRQGYVFCKGDNTENAVLNAEFAKKHIQVDSDLIA